MAFREDRLICSKRGGPPPVVCYTPPRACPTPLAKLPFRPHQHRTVIDQDRFPGRDPKNPRERRWPARGERSASRRSATGKGQGGVK